MVPLFLKTTLGSLDICTLMLCTCMVFNQSISFLLHQPITVAMLLKYRFYSTQNLHYETELCGLIQSMLSKNKGL